MTSAFVRTTLCGAQMKVPFPDDLAAYAEIIFVDGRLEEFGQAGIDVDSSHAAARGRHRVFAKARYERMDVSVPTNKIAKVGSQWKC